MPTSKEKNKDHATGVAMKKPLDRVAAGLGECAAKVAGEREGVDPVA